MLYVGLDLSRKRLDWQALLPTGERAAIGAVAPDREGLHTLRQQLGDAEGVIAGIESMSGARFVHDELELGGWDVRIADALKARRIAPLACKTDTIDTWVLAELARLELVHAILFQHGVPSTSSDLFGVRGRALLARLQLPEPWAATVSASLVLIDVLDEQIGACEQELRALGAEHRCMPLLMSCPGIGWALAFTIASEIGDIGRFPSPRKLVGYTGLCPRVEQSGERDRRGPLRKNGPNHLRWALVEAAHTAYRHPLYRPLLERKRAQ